MTEQSFLKKIINKYSKKFKIGAMSGIMLPMSNLEDLHQECEKFIIESKNEQYPEINYNDEDYKKYYKMMKILDEYFKIKYQIYNTNHKLREPKGYESKNIL